MLLSHRQDMLQRLETVLLHWTRQVKALLGQQDTGGSGEGPLAEITFWQRRGDDLSGICRQLDAPGERRNGLHACHEGGADA